MKRNFNKIIGSVLATFLLVFAIKVNAITITTDSSRVGITDTNSTYVTNQATLTVTGIQVGDSFKAYKLLDTFYNSTSNTVTYEFTSSFKNYLLSIEAYKDYTVDDYYKLTSGNITSGSTKTTSTLDKLVSGYVSYIKNNNVVGTDMTQNGNTISATLDAGAYLVLPVSTNKVYAVMVGNLDFEANGNDWVLNNESIVAKVSEAGVTKTVSDTSSKNLMQEEFTYTVVGTVPQYPTNAVNKTYKIVDTFADSITFSGISNVVVKDGTTNLVVDTNGNVKDTSGNVVAIITVNGQVLTIDFNIDYVTSTTVTVTYKAKLNDQVKWYNNNGVTLTYSNSPYTNDNMTTENVNVSVGAYGIEIFKYAGSDKDKALASAEFDIFADSALTKKVGTIVTNGDGIGRLKGLGKGTYYIRETKAPTGYQIIKDTIEVEVGSDDVAESSLTDNTLQYEVVEISNAATGILPYTGGSGLLFYSIIGIVIIGIGTVVTIKIHKKKALNVTE